MPEHAGLMAHDPGPARAAGLVVRASEATAADTAAWLTTQPPAAPGEGLTRDDERALLAAVRSGSRLRGRRDPRGRR